MTMWRHGDLLIEEVQTIPETAKKQKSLVILSSKTSGHDHKFAEKRTCRIFQFGEEWYVDVFAETASLIHPEHGSINLPTGKYRIWRQREFSRGKTGSRFVLD